MLLNLERARARMRERGLDALIATSPENVVYASGYANWTLETFRDDEVYAVVPREGELTLVLPLSGMDYLAERPADVDRLYTYGSFYVVASPGVPLSGAEARLRDLREHTPRFADARPALHQALRDLGLTGARLGVDERGMSWVRWGGLVETLAPAQVTPAGEDFRSIRRVKSAPENERLRSAAHAVEAGMHAAFQCARPGASEASLGAAFRAAVIAAGAVPGHWETSVGTRSSASFPASWSHHVQPGDIVRSDCGGRFQGYWADTGRTIAVGSPPAKLERYYQAIRAGVDAMLALIRPGVAVSALFEAGVESVRQAGIPHFERHHAGHGIGLEMYEAPLIRPDAAGSAPAKLDRLEAGMVINVELPYYELGLGGVQLEETLVVREHGYELLTAASRELMGGAGLVAGS